MPAKIEMKDIDHWTIQYDGDEGRPYSIYTYGVDFIINRHPDTTIISGFASRMLLKAYDERLPRLVEDAIREYLLTKANKRWGRGLTVIIFEEFDAFMRHGAIGINHYFSIEVRQTRITNHNPLRQWEIEAKALKNS